ncbi:MAG: molybdate ABC transporter permease subunit [Desulfobulbus sp.]|nr:molybdate ABC transporter permease subunit [Desulfobulbus sp.]
MPAASCFLAVLREPATRECLILSAKVAAIAMPLLAVVGVGLGYLLGSSKGRWLALLDFIVTLPLVFPPIATGFLLLLALGRRSFVGIWLKQSLDVEVIFSFWGVVLAACIAGLPLIVKQVQAAVRRETTRLVETALVLGKSPLTIVFRVILPSLKTSIAIGLSLAFARSLGEVGVTLMLGGNIAGRTNTISLEVYNAVFTGDYQRAFVLVTLLGLLSLAVILLTRHLARQ